MRLTRCAFWLAAAAAAAVLPQQAAGRGSAVPGQAGTARISGVVVTAEAEPVVVPRAMVSLGTDVYSNRSAVTDDQGRFVFESLPPGRYSLTAAKPAFVSAAYGARRPGRPGTPLVVGVGDAMDGVVLRMARGAVISGVVRDPNGDPAPGIAVAVVRPDATLTATSQIMAQAAGRRPLVTDDRGMYRAFGLEPGEYIVAAIPQSLSLGDIGAMTPAEIEATLVALRERAVRPGAAPGAPLTLRPGQAPAREEPRARTHTWAPVFFPGTPVRADAQRIRVAAGEDRGGVDVTLQLLPTVRIEGVVQDAGGQPVSGLNLFIAPAGASVPVSFVGAPTLLARPGPDGRFVYTGVTPGRYTITARTLGTAAAQLWAMADVVTVGEDIAGVALALRPALAVAGRLRFDGSTAAAPRPEDLQRIRVRLDPPPAMAGGIIRNTTGYGRRFEVSGAVRADSTFQLNGVLPGDYRVAAVLPPELATAGWWLRSAVVGGQELLDEGIIISEHDVRDVVFTFTDRRSELTGTLTTPAGQPAVEYFVVVFSTDQRQWRPASRRTKLARPANDGTFVFSDLPAGEYHLAALDDLDPADLDDPAFLDQIVAASVAVRMTEGGRIRQDLRIR